jgi:hypothetical protein
MKRLYIIGNGFDVHHGIKSKYSDFKIYVEEQDKELYEMLEKYFNTDELWSDFEETLAYIDTDTITDDAANFLVSYGADDWSDAYHHDYQYEIDQALELVTVKLRMHFTNWILQLNIPSSPQANIDTNAKFMNFNYTDTLERAYGIPQDRVIYIHNRAVDTESTLILGHSRKYDKNFSFSKDNNEDTDPRVAEGNELLDDYFKQTYKDTHTIISENGTFFDNLGEVDEIFVLGHSMSSVDIEYFQLLKDKVNENTLWTISYYQEKEKEQKEKIASALGIKSSNMVLKTISEL